MRRKNNLDKQIKMALMAAVSIVLLLLVKIPFPPAPFMVYDPCDVPIYITSFAYGPMAGLLVTFVVCVIQAFAMGGDGLYGFLMHFIATGAMVVVIGVIYERHKTRKTAAVSLVIGVLLSAAIMVVMNLIVTPLYMGVPRSAVVAMILPAIIPFNLLKAGVNSLITFAVYKRVSGFLHRDGRPSGGAAE